MPEFLSEGEQERRLISSNMAAIRCKLRKVWTVSSHHSFGNLERQRVLLESLKCSPSVGLVCSFAEGMRCCELCGVQHSAVQAVPLSCSPGDCSSSRLLLWRERENSSSSASNTQSPWKQKECVTQSPERYVVFCRAPLSSVQPLLTAHRPTCAVSLACLSKRNWGVIARSLTETDGVPLSASSQNRATGTCTPCPSAWLLSSILRTCETRQSSIRTEGGGFCGNNCKIHLLVKTARDLGFCMLVSAGTVCWGSCAGARCRPMAAVFLCSWFTRATASQGATGQLFRWVQSMAYW